MAQRKAFPLRIDPRLYEALHTWADDELRSVNGQIEYLLREALKRAGRSLAHGSSEPEEETPGETPGESAGD